MYKVPVPLWYAEKWASTDMYLLPNSWNLWVLPYMAKDVIRLRVLRWEDHSGLFRQALNTIACIYKREAEGDLTLRHTEKRERREDRSRDRSEVATSHGMPAATRSEKRQARILP